MSGICNSRGYDKCACAYPGQPQCVCACVACFLAGHAYALWLSFCKDWRRRHACATVASVHPGSEATVARRFAVCGVGG